ncbi:chromate transporter [Alkaliphilus serpentinus]|uniref:Chromate transporter n=1 Tax=Alkaliphilus serpentinus TaxID=1482731 RepID=A0A833M9K8_9FIRM|nr:chromate transporter [Alkaliphilus serpentinus]KAB3530075.1 chromate transporter [Alkaliphilus serpentinus]
MNIYLKLFVIFFRVGAFTFGGGYAMIPIIQKEIVENTELISEKEFLDLIVVCQSLPGALAVNTSTFIGYKIAGVLGAFIALIGTVLPSLVFIILIAIFYNRISDIKEIQLFFKGVRPAIVSLIFISVLKLGKNMRRSNFNIIIGLAAFFAITFLNIHPIVVVVFCGTAGYIYVKRRQKHYGVR